MMPVNADGVRRPLVEQAVGAAADYMELVYTERGEALQHL